MFEIRGRESPDFSAFAEPAQQKIPANHVCRDFISGNRFGTVGLLRGIVRGSLRLTFLHSFLIPSLSSFFSFSFLPSSSFCLPSLSSLPPPLAERTRFELVVRVAPYVGLANRWFQPLTHLSGHTRGRFRPKGCANIECFWVNTKKCGRKFLFLPEKIVICRCNCRYGFFYEACLPFAA